ncbi:MAG: translation elongation factor Ts [Woeseiaceae bacterium]|nr:translation elongation factor Ts [Woeseiaceae bacterium]
MTISAAMVKELRERTGAGMMECKKALVEADGDLDAAAEVLRKSGQAKADKKAGRVAADGRIVIAEDGNRAVLVEVNSETDFVAKDENFGAFADAVAAAALASGTTDAEAFAGEKLADGRTVEEARTELIAKVGENIGVRRIAAVEGGDVLASYIHGGRIGAVVALEGGDAALARDIAMHVAATNPVCVDESGVPEETLASERRILTEQAEDSGKPADIIEKMVAGRLRKFLQEITLVGQPFVKDPDTSVGKLLKDNGARVVAFVRFEVGEGIEKKADNFVEEVMAQVKGAS